ncbi:helix-turn-helix domain-containing protein [Streptomyces formicae]|uniref:AraC family transcriptional regulator n=1 Tax=Streptomyces formicae TaxID=1616117 RepID=A0ABY3WQL1_9ACTN|nr:AraC family transcriptional regulator [Streptomyces formicae]UNM13077.1 AraC family transcriptional regulator [Streptomyces formicae]
MKPRFEQPGVPSDTTWTSFVRREQAYDFGWHFHREYELTLITRGCGMRYVGTTIEPYRPGDLVLLGPDLPHTFTSVARPGGVSEAVVAQFREDFLGPGFFALPQFRDVAALLASATRGWLFARLPEALRQSLAALPSLDPAMRTTALLAALHQLAGSGAGRPITGPGYTPAPDTGVRDRVDRVCRYLQEVHTRPVGLAEVAELVHMSPTSFSRFFRRAMGRTLTDHVNQLRVQTACRLLETTELPVTEVAARSGYQNLSNFNRRFLELTRTRPRDYRTAHWPDGIARGARSSESDVRVSRRS